MAWFFRDPNRKIIADDTKILAPADGKILKIIENQENGKSTITIAIRMSPVDVHIIRSPSNFTIETITHTLGSHRSVYIAGAEEKNERKLVAAKNETEIYEILLLTGAFARRIDLWVDEGQTLPQGEKMGIIRFGSQTNLSVKSNRKLKVLVTEGAKVKAGLTSLARIE